MNGGKKVNFFNTGESRFTTYGYALSKATIPNLSAPFSDGDLLFIHRTSNEVLSPVYANIAMINEYYANNSNDYINDVPNILDPGKFKRDFVKNFKFLGVVDIVCISNEKRSVGSVGYKITYICSGRANVYNTFTNLEINSIPVTNYLEVIWSNTSKNTDINGGTIVTKNFAPQIKGSNTHSLNSFFYVGKCIGSTPRKGSHYITKLNDTKNLKKIEIKIYCQVI